MLVAFKQGLEVAVIALIVVKQPMLAIELSCKRDTIEVEVLFVELVGNLVLVLRECYFFKFSWSLMSPRSLPLAMSISIASCP